MNFERAAFENEVKEKSMESTKSAPAENALQRLAREANLPKRDVKDLDAPLI
ncbi:hypothetical protein D3C76_154590 [compost metagenome]